MNNDAVAVVLRERARDDWTLQTWAINADVGRSVVRHTVEQEAWCGNRDFEAKLMTEKDYDAGRFRVAGLCHLRARDFPERPTERMRVRVGPPETPPAPLPRPRPTPTPLPRTQSAPAPKPRILVKVPR